MATAGVISPGFWKHNMRPISFTLIVDDFGFKCVGKKHANHIISIMKKHYTVVEDWQGEKYGGNTLYLDYTKHQVHFSMPEYAKDSLIRFQHTLQKLSDQPKKHTMPVFGTTI